MKRISEVMSKTGEPLMLEALAAIKAYRDAQDGGASPDEVERLRLLADSLYRAVMKFQLLEAGSLPDPTH